MAEADTIIWISGATQGIGRGIARNVPYPNARVINLSRRQHETLESVQFDLTDRSTWERVRESFERELANFKGKRAIFIHNGIYTTVPGYIADPTTDMDRYYKEMVANAVAPTLLGDMFLRAVKPGYESGLAMITSSNAVDPFESASSYCAAKACVEMWVKVVRKELKTRGRDTWVVAVRPGFVDTPNTRNKANLPASQYPAGPELKRLFEAGQNFFSEDEAGAGIWSMLPPAPDSHAILSQGPRILEPEG